MRDSSPLVRVPPVGARLSLYMREIVPGIVGARGPFAFAGLVVVARVMRARIVVASDTMPDVRTDTPFTMAGRGIGMSFCEVRWPTRENIAHDRSKRPWAHFDAASRHDVRSCYVCGGEPIAHSWVTGLPMGAHMRSGQHRAAIRK